MTVGDWVTESVDRFRENSTSAAARQSGRELLYGVSRRTIDGVLGDSVWDRDWDVLVILDAARVDVMRETAPEYEKLGMVGDRWSEASCSLEWIDRVFGAERREEALNAGYVTANPFSGHGADDVMSVDLVEGRDVAFLDEVWRDGWEDIGGGVETVPPETVTNRAIDAWRRREEHGIDRLIVHYMQPHQPFRSKPEWLGHTSNLANLMEPGRDAGSCLWERLSTGEFDESEFWSAYQDNLRWVLDDVTERLLWNCAAKVAISADHGNCMGEWGVWGHPPGMPMPAVRKVPWVEAAGCDLESVDANGHDRVSDAGGRDAVEQLDALGYL